MVDVCLGNAHNAARYRTRRVMLIPLGLLATSLVTKDKKSNDTTLIAICFANLHYGSGNLRNYVLGAMSKWVRPVFEMS